MEQTRPRRAPPPLPTASLLHSSFPLCPFLVLPLCPPPSVSLPLPSFPDLLPSPSFSPSLPPSLPSRNACSPLPPKTRTVQLLVLGLQLCALLPELRLDLVALLLKLLQRLHAPLDVRRQAGDKLLGTDTRTKRVCWTGAGDEGGLTGEEG
eukprot:365697-Chlamydomonas_euryale.AAC.12